jgi:hypothetical protein
MLSASFRHGITTDTARAVGSAAAGAVIGGAVVVLIKSLGASV